MKSNKKSGFRRGGAISSSSAKNQSSRASPYPAKKPASKGLERAALVGLLIGCIVILYLAQTLISTTHSLDGLGIQTSLRVAFKNSHIKWPASVAETSRDAAAYIKAHVPDLGIDIGGALHLADGITKATVLGSQPEAPATQLTLPSKDDIEAYYAATNMYPDEKYIELMPGRKTGIRQDRRVVFRDDFPIAPHIRPPGEPSGIRGRPRALIATEEILQRHPYHQLVKKLRSQNQYQISLEDTIEYVQRSGRCEQKPVFLTMATVGDDLYWQLIENFVYTMVKYNVSDCSLVICVSDAKCMDLCGASYFPCYNYQSEAVKNAIAAGKDPSQAIGVPSVMEQIAEVKLLHIPKALTKKVDVFMLDLDVGFLADPMIMVKTFYATPRVDIFVQEDMIFVMNRSAAAWRTWSVEPLPNIGLFLCRGNNKTARVFEIAWDRYQKMSDPQSKKDPGKDQNQVLEGMRNSRVKIGLRYAYFSNYTAILMDKYVRLTDPSSELGGEATAIPLQERKSIAVHMTCYEFSTKVMGLKATNAFWNPKYYDPLRRTITKSLLYHSDQQLQDEVRSLIWLGLRTDRAVIVPNILGGNDLTVRPYSDKQLKLWPGFRVVKFKRMDGRNQLKVDVLEPGFYWRVQRDYDDVPTPKIVIFHPDSDSLEDIRLQLEQVDYIDYPRIVLYPSSPSKKLIGSYGEGNPTQAEMSAMINRAVRWAEDSVGWFERGYTDEFKAYGLIPSVENIRNLAQDTVDSTLQGIRTCNKIFIPMKGNRSCFQICE